MTQRKALTTDAIIEAEARYIVQTYKRPPVVFTRGEGSTSMTKLESNIWTSPLELQ